MLNILNQIDNLNTLDYPDISIRYSDQDRIWERFYAIGNDLRTARIAPFSNIVDCFYTPWKDKDFIVKFQ